MTINPTPPVDCRRGAPLGRYCAPNDLETSAGRLYLRRIPLDSGGYDSGGAYWGHGAPLWYVEDQNGNSEFFRAASRGAAKATITADWPGATFFR